MAIHTYCIACDKFGPVYPKGLHYFLFCKECFPYILVTFNEDESVEWNKMRSKS